MSPGQRPSKTNYCCAFIALVLLSIAVFDDDLPFMTVSDDKVYHWTINDQNVNVSVEMHYNLRDVVQCRTFRGDSGINVRNPSLSLLHITKWPERSRKCIYYSELHRRRTRVSLHGMLTISGTLHIEILCTY